MSQPIYPSPTDQPLHNAEQCVEEDSFPNISQDHLHVNADGTFQGLPETAPSIDPEDINVQYGGNPLQSQTANSTMNTSPPQNGLHAQSGKRMRNPSEASDEEDCISLHSESSSSEEEASSEDSIHQFVVSDEQFERLVEDYTSLSESYSSSSSSSPSSSSVSSSSSSSSYESEGDSGDERS